MNEKQLIYEVGQRVLITGTRSIHHGKTGTITGIFCLGAPDKEQYLVHLDDDQESTRVYHIARQQLEHADCPALYELMCR